MSSNIAEMFERLHDSVDSCLRKLQYSSEFRLKSPGWTGSEGFQQSKTTLEGGRMWGGECFHR